jgi:hypothetical protein
MGAVFAALETFREYQAFLSYNLEKIAANLRERDHCLVFYAYFESQLRIMLTDTEVTFEEVLYETLDKSGLIFTELRITIAKEDVQKFGDALSLTFLAVSSDSMAPYSSIAAAITNITIVSGGCLSSPSEPRR